VTVRFHSFDADCISKSPSHPRKTRWDEGDYQIVNVNADNDVLERIVSGRTKINQLHVLLPWNWKAERNGSEAKLAA